MEEIIDNSNRHTLTAYVASTKNTEVLVRVTKEEAEKIVNHSHFDLILKNVFSGASEMRTIPVEYELADFIELIDSDPFYLHISLLDGTIKSRDILGFFPEGWRYDDPCITTFGQYEEMTTDDYIVNLRTEEIIFFMKPDNVTKIYKTSEEDYPKVSGEAQLIFSMFIHFAPTDLLMYLYKAPVPANIDWYEEFRKEDVGDTTSFFSEKSSTIEEQHRDCFPCAYTETEDPDAIHPCFCYAIDLMSITPGLYEYFRKRVHDGVA